MNTVSSIIRQFILCTHLPGESPDTLGDDTPLQSSGILDSLAVVGLIAFLEKQFQIELDVYDTAIDRFDTIHDITAVVVRKQTRAYSS
jgi:acyl carrier protein